MVAFPEYTYIAVLGVIFGFIFAFGIGANDVANAFGSSVSARSLKLWQAIILGSIFEFTGAILLGASVTGTIRGKIIKPEFYEDDPQVFMFGALCALMVGMIWLLIATYKEFPVSTTHDIVAAYLGFSIAAKGFQSIDWYTCGMIFVSWFAAPIFAGILASIFFKTLLEVVLKHENTFERALNVYPVVVFVALTANIFFVLSKSGGNNVKMDDWDWGHKVVLPASLGGGVFFAALTWLVICPWLRKRVHAEHEDGHVGEEKTLGSTSEHLRASGLRNEDTESAELEDVKGAELEDTESNREYDVDSCELPVRSSKRLPKTVKSAESEDVDVDSWELAVRSSSHFGKPALAEKPEKVLEELTPFQSESGPLVKLWNFFADNTFRQDLHAISMGESKRAAAIWEHTTEFDRKSEYLFQYLQIFTACLASFAHGSNDVANAIAPVSGILQIYRDGEFVSKADVNKGILAMGGIAISLGFTLFGYRIIKSVGFKLTAISPSRGFCIELGAALSVSLASFMQIPVSTTQCLVGATCGVGLAGGGPKNVEWWFLLRTLCGWIGIFFIVAFVEAGVFSFCVFSPSL